MSGVGGGEYWRWHWLERGVGLWVLAIVANALVIDLVLAVCLLAPRLRGSWLGPAVVPRGKPALCVLHSSSAAGPCGRASVVLA